MSNKQRINGLDRRDEMVLIAIAILIPLLTIPAMLGV